MIEFIEIQCPKCGETHRYPESVTLSLYSAISNISDILFSLLLKAFLKRRYKGGPDRFTRLFTCPVKHEDFQVLFTRDASSGNMLPIHAGENAQQKEE
jgi:hypothetical protein